MIGADAQTDACIEIPFSHDLGDQRIEGIRVIAPA